MRLNVILTSYNRPAFLARALDSLLAQTDPRWYGIVMDDGSDAATIDVLKAKRYRHPQLKRLCHPQVTPAERARTTRYSVLINEAYDYAAHIGLDASGGVVGYLCDNTEYAPELVATVLDFFDRRPDVYAGYVTQARDSWQGDAHGDGVAHLGGAELYGHWAHMPGVLAERIMHPRGQLDHSQVFHRLPCEVRWSEAVEHKAHGDAVFFERLVTRYGPIYAIAPGRALTKEHLVK